MSNEKSKDPAFLFYARDYYEGTRTMLPVERACYIDLLCYQHQHGGFIPNDIERISMYCSGSNQATLIAVLQAKFVQSEEGWYNVRLRKERDQRKEFGEKQSKNGKIGHFWKLCKKSLSSNDYERLKTFRNQYTTDEFYDLVITKQQKTDQGSLQAMLKHIVVADSVVVDNADAVNYKNGVGKNIDPFVPEAIPSEITEIPSESLETISYKFCKAYGGAHEGKVMQEFKKVPQDKWQKVIDSIESYKKSLGGKHPVSGANFIQGGFWKIEYRVAETRKSKTSIDHLNLAEIRSYSEIKK